MRILGFGGPSFLFLLSLSPATVVLPSGGVEEDEVLDAIDGVPPLGMLIPKRLSTAAELEFFVPVLPLTVLGLLSRLGLTVGVFMGADTTPTVLEGLGAVADGALAIIAGMIGVGAATDITDGDPLLPESLALAAGAFIEGLGAVADGVLAIIAGMIGVGAAMDVTDGDPLLPESFALATGVLILAGTPLKGAAALNAGLSVGAVTTNPWGLLRKHRNIAAESSSPSAAASDGAELGVENVTCLTVIAPGDLTFETKLSEDTLSENRAGLGIGPIKPLWSSFELAIDVMGVSKRSCLFEFFYL